MLPLQLRMSPHGIETQGCVPISLCHSTSMEGAGRGGAGWGGWGSLKGFAVEDSERQFCGKVAIIRAGS